MRKILFVLALLVGAFIINGCTPSGGGGGGGSTYYMKATVAPSNMNTTMCIASVNASAGNSLAITGSTISGGVGGPPIIALCVYNWSGGTGTFALSNPGSAAPTMPFGQYTAGGGAYSKNSSSGTLTITSVSATAISGSFSFTCTDGTAITAGTFNAERK